MNEQNSRLLEKLNNSNSRVLESFQISIEHNCKNLIWTNPNFVLKSQLRRYCKTHTILFSKTNLKRIKLIQTVFFRKLKK